MMLRQVLWTTVATLPVLLGAAGCSTTEVADPLTGNLAANDENTQLEFWHTLNDRKITSNDEAFHGILLLLDSEDTQTDYSGRLEALRSRGLMPPGFDRPANEAVNRGTVAVAVMRTLDFKGGVMTRLFPFSARYATRELQYLGLYPRSSPHQTFSGPEFLAIIGRVEDYQRVVSVRRPAAQFLNEGEPTTDATGE